MLTFDDVCTAMDKGELFVEYLPAVSLRDQRCVGAEALVRWRRGNTVVQPDEFLHLVEHTPVSGRLTYWVIDTVAAELETWLGDHPQARISINVPPEILGRGASTRQRAPASARARTRSCSRSRNTGSPISWASMH
jgi:sensor c-di-GMP phosphodiesterase-like protein